MSQLIPETPRRRFEASTLVIVAAAAMLFVYDATAGITERASISSAGVQGNGISGRTSQRLARRLRPAREPRPSRELRPHSGRRLKGDIVAHQ